MNAHISTLDLHRHRYGELAGDDAARVLTHLDACERCRGRLAVQLRERDAFAVVPTPTAIRRLSIPDQPANTPWPRILAVGTLIAAAAAAAFVAVPRIDQVAGAVDDGIEDTRPKGDLPALELWVQGSHGLRALKAGETLRAGDRVQLLFRPEGAAWVTLAGRDGTGTLEVWGTAEPIGDHLQPAPFGLTLDDTPGPQTFYAIGADLPLDADGVARILDGDRDGARVTALTIPKE